MISFLRFAFGRLSAVVLLTVFGLILPAAPAAAQVDLNGSWSIVVDVSGVYSNTQVWNLVQEGSMLSGSGGAGGYTWNVHGSIDGNQAMLDISYNEISYQVFASFIINGSTMTGTWSDSSEQSGGMVGTKIGVSGEIASATSLACVRGPAATDDFVCTATVTGSPAQSPAPTGLVTFTTHSGSFRNGSDCHLSSVSQQSSSCGVTLMQPIGGFQSGHPVPVSASYGGDETYLASSAASAVTTVTTLPKTPTVCLSDAGSACSGLNIDALDPEITGNTFGTVSFGYFSPIGSRSEGPYLPAAKVSAPKGKGEIAVEFRYVARLKDNPALQGSRAIKNLATQLRNGLIIASTQTKVGFGQRKDVVVNLNSKGQKLVNSLRGAGISQIKLSIAAGVKRKGDRRGTSIASKTDASIR